MKTYRGVAVSINSFLTTALNGCGQRQDPAALPPLKEPPVLIPNEAEAASEGVLMFWSRDNPSPSLVTIIPK